MNLDSILQDAESLLSELQESAENAVPPGRVEPFPESAESAVLTPHTETLPDEARLSLVERAERIFYHGRETPDAVSPEEPRIYPDGYTRRSPTQSYRVPEGYFRRLTWKAALYSVAAVMLLILLLELIKRKLLRF